MLSHYDPKGGLHLCGPRIAAGPVRTLLDLDHCHLLSIRLLLSCIVDRFLYVLRGPSHRLRGRNVY